MACASTARKHCRFNSFFQIIKNWFLPHLLVTQSFFSLELWCSQNLSYTKTSFALPLLSNYYPASSYQIFSPLISISIYLLILLIAFLELWFHLFCLTWTVLASCILTKKELLKEFSYYITHLRLKELRENECNMSKRYKGNVKTVECREGEPICCDKSSDPGGPFCFFYATLFKKVLLRLPLSIF